jgi:hypothetical protein
MKKPECRCADCRIKWLECRIKWLEYLVDRLQITKADR